MERDKVQSLFEDINLKYNEINGIVFSAGLINYGTFNSMSDTDFEKTLAIKIKGINILHDVVKNLRIDFVYMISSVSGLSPYLASGMSGYGAANAYLDTYAEQCSSTSTPWISVAWSIWEETGMSKNLNFPKDLSMTPICLTLAFELFEKSIGAGQSNLVAIDKLDASKFTFHWVERKLKMYDYNPNPPFEKEIIQPKPNTQNFKFIITQLISEATQIQISEINEDESFSSLGLDSISALDIVGQLEKEYQFTLNPTLLYEYDSISRLSEYFSNLNVSQEHKSFVLLPTQKAFYSNQVFYPESPCNSLVKITFEKQLDSLLLQNPGISFQENTNPCV
ncbi:MAG: KR domain-containing protein [Saprospiraceae bacterium]|nr:KR domain-containing protein [Saprospiraceae bacterium]